MKTKILASLITATLLSVSSMSAFATEPAPQRDTIVSVNGAKSYADSYSKAQLEIELLKQTLQKNQLQDQIRQIKEKETKASLEAQDKANQKKWDEEKKELIEKYEAKLSALSENSDESENKSSNVSIKSKMDKVFVTRISAIGGQMKAKVYVDNSIATKGIGDTVIEGVKIVGINKDGIVIAHNDYRKFIQITTISRAQFKSFEQNEVIDVQDKSGINNQMMRTDFPQSSPFPTPVPGVQ
ncbi:hypothetical protein D3C87_351580 [compost metagenome]